MITFSEKKKKVVGEVKKVLVPRNQKCILGSLHVLTRKQAISRPIPVQDIEQK